MAFVLSLRPGWYRAQFAALAWAHMAVFFAVVQSSFFVANAYQGIIWSGPGTSPHQLADRVTGSHYGVSPRQLLP